MADVSEIIKYVSEALAFVTSYESGQEAVSPSFTLDLTADGLGKAEVTVHIKKV